MKRFRLTSGESIGAIVLVVCMALPVAMHLCSPRGHADAAAQAAADSAAQARIDSMQHRAATSARLPACGTHGPKAHGQNA